MSLLSFMLFIQRRKWQPTPVLLPGKSHGWRSLIGYSPRCGVAKSQTWLSSFTSLHMILWTAAHQASPCPSLSPGVCSNLCSLSKWSYLWRGKWQTTSVFFAREPHGQHEKAIIWAQANANMLVSILLGLFACLSLSVISVVTGLALAALVRVADALSNDHQETLKETKLITYKFWKLHGTPGRHSEVMDR